MGGGNNVSYDWLVFLSPLQQSNISSKVASLTSNASASLSTALKAVSNSWSSLTPASLTALMLASVLQGAALAVGKTLAAFLRR